MGVFQGSCCSIVRNSTAEGLFTRAYSDRTRRKGFKLREFSSDFRKKFFTANLMRNQHRLLREAVDAPALKSSRQGWLEL